MSTAPRRMSPAIARLLEFGNITPTGPVCNVLSGIHLTETEETTLSAVVQGIEARFQDWRIIHDWTLGNREEKLRLANQEGYARGKRDGIEEGRKLATEADIGTTLAEMMERVADRVANEVYRKRLWVGDD